MAKRSRATLRDGIEQILEDERNTGFDTTAIYMAGKGNRYRHPHGETLAALQDIGA
jgi:hypothetical protein